MLELINDVLDISKIEAGKLSVNAAALDIDEIKVNIIRDFNHVAEQKGLMLDVIVDEHCPVTIYTDGQRLDQIIKNLLSNAIKFTDHGTVTVRLFQPDKTVDLSRSGLNPEQALAVAVSDTGIGVPEQKRLEIFEAFQQADGSTSRKYGGTGLGLSISRELAKLLGGEITLVSAEGRGSTFTVYIPLKFRQKTEASPGNPGKSAVSGSGAPPVARPASANSADNTAGVPPAATGDDRNNLAANEKTILIIEDDSTFARVLLAKCHDRGFRGLVAGTGEEGLELAARYRPDAVILDIILPGMDGYGVLEALKADTSLRHIPVHMISGIDQDISVLRKGAIGFSRKPLQEDSLHAIFGTIESLINQTVKKILLVEDDKILQMTVKKLLKEENVEIFEAATGAVALEKLEANQFDCVILDLGLPDMSGAELLEKINSRVADVPPVIIYTGKDLEPEEIKKFEKLSKSIIIKGVKSEERLIDEVALFLHQVVKNLDEEKRKTIARLYDKDNPLAGKKVLIVDDDMRNVFALSGLFEEKAMQVVEAENGEVALAKLREHLDVDIIVMDIMMPVLDGYETMRRIRKIPEFAKTPIIALTAKAMPEDRGKCIEAGASDYLSKPVKEDRLFSMMRAWLYR